MASLTLNSTLHLTLTSLAQTLKSRAMTLWLWQEWQIANLCSNGAAGTRLRSEKWISCKQQYLRRPTYFSWHNPNLLSVAPNLYMRSPKWVSGRGSSGCPWRKSRLIAPYGQQMEMTVAAGVKGIQRISYDVLRFPRNSYDFLRFPNIV